MKNKIKKTLYLSLFLTTFLSSNVFSQQNDLEIMAKVVGDSLTLYANNFDYTAQCSVRVFATSVEHYCNGKNVSENANFNDSSNPPDLMGGDCACSSGSNGGKIGWQCKHNVYKHILNDGRVMYSQSNDANHFNDGKCLLWKLPADKVLSLMPDIGLANIDPNLIEY